MHITELYTADDAELDQVAARHPNPECRYWCDGQHEPTEFAAADGILWCRKKFQQREHWGVYVEQVTKVSDVNSNDVDDVLGAPLALCAPTLNFFPPPEEIPAEEAREFAVAVAAAAAMCVELRQAADRELRGGGGGVLRAIASAERDALLAHRDGRCADLRRSCSYCETKRAER